MKPIKVVDLELTRPPEWFEELVGYGSLQALVRLHGVPVGYVTVPVSDEGRLRGSSLVSTAFKQHHWRIMRHLFSSWIEHHGSPVVLPQGGPEMAEALLDLKPRRASTLEPSVTVAVCTRDRTDDLASCLESLANLHYGNYQVLVVDNAPRTDGTEHLIRTSFPDVRYVREPRPGLNWARNRAILEATGEVVAFTDDDVEVDPEWLTHLVAALYDNPTVQAVTGLVVPLELETEAQVLFEKSGGFGRGFERRWYTLDTTSGRRNKLHVGRGLYGKHYGGGLYGTGANMAFRRDVFGSVGMFDPALDAGTATRGAGDLEMYVRILQDGHALVYEPRAFVRHRHRRELQELESQLASWGSGTFAAFTAAALRYPRERRGLVAFGLWWFWHRGIRRFAGSFVKPSALPHRLIWAELRGAAAGPYLYFKARRDADGIRSQHGDLAPSERFSVDTLPQHERSISTVSSSEAVSSTTLTRSV